MVAELVAIGIAVVLAGVWYWHDPSSAKRWVHRMAMMKEVIYSILGLGFTLVLIGTGSTPLIILGVLLLTIGVLSLFFTRPDQTVLEVLRDLLP